MSEKIPCQEVLTCFAMLITIKTVGAIWLMVEKEGRSGRASLDQMRVSF